MSNDSQTLGGRIIQLSREATALHGKSVVDIRSWWNGVWDSNRDIPPSLLLEPLHHVARAFAETGDMEAIKELEATLESEISKFEKTNDDPILQQIAKKAASFSAVPEVSRHLDQRPEEWMLENWSTLKELLRVDHRLKEAGQDSFLSYVYRPAFFVSVGQKLAGRERALWQSMRTYLRDDEIPGVHDLRRISKSRPISLSKVVRLHKALQKVSDNAQMELELRGLGLVGGLPAGSVTASLWAPKTRYIARYCETRGIRRRDLEHVITQKLPANGVRIFGHSTLGKGVSYGVTTFVAEVIVESVNEVSGSRSVEFKDLFFMPPPKVMEALPIAKGNAVDVSQGYSRSVSGA